MRSDGPPTAVVISAWRTSLEVDGAASLLFNLLQQQAESLENRSRQDGEAKSA
jgi:hypothetical protein